MLVLGGVDSISTFATSIIPIIRFYRLPQHQSLAWWMSVICATRPKSMRPNRPSSKSILRSVTVAHWRKGGMMSDGCFLKWWVFPPNHPWINRVFPYKVYPFWEFYPYFWKHPSDIIPFKEKNWRVAKGKCKILRVVTNSPIFINLQLVLDVWTLQKGPCERSWPTYQHRRCGKCGMRCENEAQTLGVYIQCSWRSHCLSTVWRYTLIKTRQLTQLTSKILMILWKQNFL